MPTLFNHRHLYGIEQLSRHDIETILNLANAYADRNRTNQKKSDKLAGKTIVNMFFENSTRTRTSFELAAKRLGADVINFTAQSSSMKKGETLSDTMRVINAMRVDGFVIRHSEDGAVKMAVNYVDGSVINAGDGQNEHPTQALLDALTLVRRKGRLDGLIIAVCGDIKHSRVAKSNALLLNKMGAEVRFFSPPQFELTDYQSLGVVKCDRFESAIDNADAIMMLRIQNERLTANEFKISEAEYHSQYGLNHDRLKLAKPNVIVMHPAPINRGVEITSELADDPQFSVIFEQMEMGVAVRMACLDLLVK
ncbi:MAG: aspartate carbamoyltransferase catalytic subunit [Alphaproteobacteria bacterium]|nr:aspartate carbamoyltransferase catalytic subunit [Alphaproteobacteria bacterium]